MRQEKLKRVNTLCGARVLMSLEIILKVELQHKWRKESVTGGITKYDGES